MRLRHLGPITVLLLIAACTGTGSLPAASTAVPAASSPGAATSGAARDVAIKLTDALRMDPASATVKAGTPVRFVVTNTGATEHEFFIGDEAAQMTHESEMGRMAMGDDANGISLKPGETKAVEHTFAMPGAYLAGCHVAGHYAGGMKAAITVTG